MRSFERDLLASLREPEFWAYSSWLDIVTKYRRSRLGLVWLLLPPLLYVGGIGYLFAGVYGKDPLVFMPHLGVGYLIFRLLTNIITESSGVLSGHAGFILDGRVRLTDFVLRTLAKALFYSAAALPIVVVALALSPILQPIGLVLFIPSFLLILWNTVWIGMVVALLGARFPDIKELTGSLFLFAFVFTPIIWYASHTPPGSIRGAVMRVNPLFHMVELVRAPLLGEAVEAGTLAYLGIMSVLGWIVAGYLYRRYARFVPIWV
ncbi:ABC-2 type transport system permease protein/lipopolysaccharide transport system permease protein [Luteimonas cucumeris]|uniref:ABC-2 type transport system permease protein/lipopolysaccharide transport system permease protein n=1 Tax=Luteimonas cucumeris TaxID=985012 RepID=A0A562L6B2_9GAMM|nr:ABC transporter permease [Luteimonas cucumeris]TWI02984.1 ABC-2 type transport system permease protein/lipopolysaccharide transport system permease protein [Luteimonas cucumeris]